MAKTREITLTRNYLYKYILNVWVANRNIPDPETGENSVVTILNGGGSRAGKTYSIADVIHTIMTHYGDKRSAGARPLHIIVYRDTLVSARDTYKDFIDCYRGKGLLEGSADEIKRGAADYTTTNSANVKIEMYGHLIEFKGLPEDGKEPTGCDIVFINELIEHKNQSMFDRILRKVRLLALADWNPKDSVHFAYNIKGHNVFYTVTTYWDNKHLPDGLKAKAEKECPWPFEECELYLETHDVMCRPIYKQLPPDFNFADWKAGKYQFDGFIRRRWLKEERPQNCREEDYHLYRGVNKQNEANGSINRNLWLTYGEGIQSGQEGMIFGDMKWVDSFPESADNVHFGLDMGFSCFDGDTLINTINGNVKIKDIKIGDYVLTSDGYKKVLKTHCNGYKEVGENIIETDFGYTKIFCTFDHYFKTAKEWKQFKELQKQDILYMTASSMAKNIQGDLTQNIQITSTHQKKNYYTEIFGNFIMAKYQKGSIYITLMKIRLIMILKTLLSYQVVNTAKYITIFKKRTVKQGENTAIQKKTGLKEDKRLLNPLKTKLGYAFNVVLSLLLQIHTKEDALQNATINTNTQQKSLKNYISALFAEELSCAINTLNKKLAQSNVHTSCQAQIKQVTTETKKISKVYDLTIADCHEYFANGILVHNCDPSCLTRVGNIGINLYIEKLTYQPTATSDLLFDLIERPLLDEERRRYIEANGEEWYDKLLSLRADLRDVTAAYYKTTEQRAERIAEAKEKLLTFKEGGIAIDKIVVVCDTQDIYKGRGGMEEQAFVTDLNRLSVLYGYYWNFIKVGSKPIVPGISLMKKFNLHGVRDNDFKLEQENYLFVKTEDGKPTNLPDKNSKWNHIWDSARYCIWRMFKHLVVRE